MYVVVIVSDILYNLYLIAGHVSSEENPNVGQCIFIILCKPNSSVSFLMQDDSGVSQHNS